MTKMEAIIEAIEQAVAVVLFLAAVFLFSTYFTKTQVVEDTLNININSKTQISRSLVGNNLQNFPADEVFELILSTSAETVYIGANDVSSLLVEIHCGNNASMVRLKNYLHHDKSYVVEKEYDDNWQLKTIRIKEGAV